MSGFLYCLDLGCCKCQRHHNGKVYHWHLATESELCGPTAHSCPAVTTQCKVEAADGDLESHYQVLHQDSRHAICKEQYQLVQHVIYCVHVNICSHSKKNNEYAAPLNQESSTLYVTISQHNLVQFVCSLFLLDTQPPSGLFLSFDSTAARVFFLFWNRLCWLESAQFISSLLLHKKLALIGSKIIFMQSQANLWGKVHSCDRDTRARNVPLGCADIHWGGRLHDVPKECLYRRLGSLWPQIKFSGWNTVHVSLTSPFCGLSSQILSEVQIDLM